VIQCPVVVTGNLTGSSADLLRINNCGLLSVLGETHFTSFPQLEYDFRAIGGITPRSYHKFMVFGHPTTTTTSFKPAAINVWSPTVNLCSKSVTGASAAYMFLYDCSIAVPSITLPTSDFLIASEGHPAFNYDLFEDGDINNPNFTGAVPVAPHAPGAHVPGPHVPSTHAPTHNNSGTSHHLAGWAVFLIVLAVLFLIAAVIGLIAYTFVKKSAGSETV